MESSWKTSDDLWNAHLHAICKACPLWSLGEVLNQSTVGCHLACVIWLPGGPFFHSERTRWLTMLNKDNDRNFALWNTVVPRPCPLPSPLHSLPPIHSFVDLFPSVSLMFVLKPWNEKCFTKVLLICKASNTYHGFEVYSIRSQLWDCPFLVVHPPMNLVRTMNVFN